MSHFKEAAKTWDTDKTRTRNQIFASAISAHLPSSSLGTLDVLDFGCGTGLLGEALLQNKDLKVSRLVGIDSVEEMIEEFILKFIDEPRARGYSFDIEKGDWKDELGAFDVLVTAMAFHHLDQPLAALKNLKKYMNPGGKIFIIDLDEEDGSFHPDPKAMGVKHFGFSQKERDQWAQEAGFSKVLHEVIFEIEKNERSYPVLMSVFDV